MVFKQTYKVIEHGIGIQEINFLISDNYEELFNPENPITTNIFTPDTKKEDLNTEDGKFAIDELSFSCLHTSCKTDNDIKAMYFVLDAAEIKTTRYCAMFFGNIDLSNLFFLGKIEAKFSGTDKKWNGKNWEYIINPLREYKFSAMSFDMSMLEQCLISGKIYKIENNEQVKVDNLNERWLANDMAEIKNHFKHRVFYWRNEVNDKYCYFSPLGNLYSVLNKYLEFSSAILNEKNYLNINFNLMESDLGYNVSPAGYNFSLELVFNYVFQKWEAKKLQNIRRMKLKSNIATNIDTETTPYIHVRMIAPFIGVDLNNDNYSNQAGNEKTYSFTGLNNISELLYECARSLGCYIRAEYISSSDINIYFVSRNNIIESDYTYIKHATSADINTSSIISSDPSEYYSIANNYAADGFDNFKQGEVSDKFEENAKQRKEKEDRSNINQKRILFSSAPTMITRVDTSNNTANKTPEPLNACYSENLIESFNYANYNYWTKYLGLRGENLHTSLYIPIFPVPEAEVHSGLGGLIPVYRPVCGIQQKYNDTNLNFETLSDYITFITGNDKQYYETEYSITIPAWNGFSKSNDGSNPSWKNIKLGSKIKLAETVKRFINGNWEDATIVRDYVVVGKETNLKKPETKLKLHNIERFAYGFWDGDIGQLPTDTYNPIPQNTIADLVEGTSGEFTVAANETILQGDAVMVMADETIRKSQSNSIYYGKTRGIALENGIGGDKIRVQTTGAITLDWFNWDMNKPIWCRTVNSGTNLTQNPLLDKTTEEDLYLVIGKPLDTTTLLIDIDEYKFV